MLNNDHDFRMVKIIRMDLRIKSKCQKYLISAQSFTFVSTFETINVLQKKSDSKSNFKIVFLLVKHKKNGRKEEKESEISAFLDYFLLQISALKYLSVYSLNNVSARGVYSILKLLTPDPHDRIFTCYICQLFIFDRN